MRFARGPGCDRIRYDRPAATAIGADKYARIGAARDQDVGILRVEGHQCRLGIAAKPGKGGGTSPVLVHERTATGHRAVKAGVVRPRCAAICREHHPRPGWRQVRGVKPGRVAWIDRKNSNTTARQITVDANPRTRRVGPDEPPELIRSSPVAHAGLHEKRWLTARHTELDAACTGGRRGRPELRPDDRSCSHIVGDEYPLRRHNDEVGCSEVADHIDRSETRKGAGRIGVNLGSARHAWIAKEQAIPRRGREDSIWCTGRATDWSCRRSRRSNPGWSRWGSAPRHWSLRNCRYPGCRNRGLRRARRADWNRLTPTARAHAA